MKHLPGADPELVLLNHRYQELEVSTWEVDGKVGQKSGQRALTQSLHFSESHSAK